jgi:hypothetical protein
MLDINEKSETLISTFNTTARVALAETVVEANKTVVTTLENAGP